MTPSGFEPAAERVPSEALRRALPPGRSPRITLVVPVLNQAAFLGPCLNSILSQGYPNLDLRVVDVGSTDGTIEILRAIGPALGFWCSGPDAGHYDAVNKGFAGSDGEIMGWLNADDLLLPGALQALGEIFSDLPEVEWLTTLSPAFLDCAGTLSGVGRCGGFDRLAFLEGLTLPGDPAPDVPVGGHCVVVQQESTFWRRSLWERAGGRLDCAYPLAADFELWARFHTVAPLYCTRTLLGAFRNRAGQRSEAAEAYVGEAREVLRRARSEAGWSARDRRRRLLWDRLGQLPWLGPAVRDHFRFESRVVRRAEARLPDSRWVVQRERYVEP